MPNLLNSAVCLHFFQLQTEPSNQEMTEMDENMEKSSETEQNKVHQCLGPNRSNPVFSTENEFTCILCQEEEELKIEGKFLTKNWTKNFTNFFFTFQEKP